MLHKVDPLCRDTDVLHLAIATAPNAVSVLAQPVPNVALHGISSQSSTNSYYGYARNANDGSLANNYLRGQCSYTKKEHEPHWMVDLLGPHRVLSVAITNRVLECCKERLYGAEVHVGNDPSNGGKLNPKCGVISSIESGETLSFSCKGMEGQYVSVNIPDREEHLVLCEVQVYGVPVSSHNQVAVPKDLKTPNGAPNVALKGVSQQSSLYNMYGESKNAIDGSLDSNYIYIQCTGTSEQKDPWWMVDLKGEFKVFTVAVTNRGDCCAERINGAQVRIGNSAEDGGTKNPICGIISSMPNGKTLAFECDGMVGRYVTIYIPGENRSLSICEVQVFGLPTDAEIMPDDDKTDPDYQLPDWTDFLFPWFFGDDDSEEEESPKQDIVEEVEEEGENLAFRGIVSQSSTYDKFGAAENAIDGSTSSRYMSQHCSHTDLEFKPWWMVDINKVYNVTKVIILNRGDCCKDRIEGAEIRVGNSAARGGTRNPICATITSLGLGKEQGYICGLVGKYVTVTLPRTEYLALCEVKVYGKEVPDDAIGIPMYQDSTEIKEEEAETINALRDSNAAPNVALNGEATQSSTNGGNSSNAIDGSLNTCTQTEKEGTPSWMVDLKSVHKVFFIAVTSSIDSTPEELSGAEITVLNPTAKGTKSKICGTVSFIGPGETFSFNCQGTEGQYITVKNPGTDKVLRLCEVQVFGHPVPSPGEDSTEEVKLQKKHHGVKNVAPQGIAFQSSHYQYRDDEKRAIDGSLASDYMRHQCSHTRYEKTPSWMVDLKSKYHIQSVAITNRVDCCRERINGAEVHIGNSKEAFGLSNPRCGVVFKMNYGETLIFNCNEMEGQYVSIIIPNQKQYLSLCEVQVFGEPTSQEATLAPQPFTGVKGLPDQKPTPAGLNLTGRYFLFPTESDNSYVTLSPALPLNLKAFTLCMNLSVNFPEQRETILFSYRTNYYDELNVWQEENGMVSFYMNGDGIHFSKLDRSKDWTHLCLTWESKNGRCELWMNGKRSGNRIYRKKHQVRSGGIVILGQDQDSLGRDFQQTQSFVGKIKDVNMWDRVLSLKALKLVFKEREKQKGNIFDWSELRFSKIGNVQIV
ncbi:uncharacterized protein PAF06_000406 [Gastrophryne carolinensis]